MVFFTPQNSPKSRQTSLIQFSQNEMKQNLNGHSQFGVPSVSPRECSDFKDFPKVESGGPFAQCDDENLLEAVRFGALSCYPTTRPTGPIARAPAKCGLL